VENLDAVRNEVAVVLHSLQEPPAAIAAVVTGTVAAVQQIGEHTVPQHRCRRNKHVARVRVTAGAARQSAQRDHTVAAPGAHAACAKVRNSCRQRRQLLQMFQRGVPEKVSIQQREDVTMFSACAGQACSELQ
jgi:hypothetical protein